MFNLSAEEEINLNILRSEVDDYAKVMQISGKVYLTVDPSEEPNACAVSSSRGNAVAIGRVWLKGYMNDTSKKIELIKLIDNFPNEPEDLISHFQNLTSREKKHLQTLMVDSNHEISDEEIESVLLHELGHIKLNHSVKSQWVNWGNKTIHIMGSCGLIYLYSILGMDTHYSKLTLTASAVSLYAFTSLVPNFVNRKFETEADLQGRFSGRNISGRIIKGECRLHKRSLLESLLNGKNINPLNSTHPSNVERLKKANHYEKCFVKEK